jgi:hypothetical protein
MTIVQSVLTDFETSEQRQRQLLEIMVDAAKSVLERPNTRRGPYVIDDSDLRLRENLPR